MLRKDRKNISFDSWFNIALLEHNIKIFKNYPIFGVGNKNFREECSKKEYENKEYKWTDQRCSTHPHQIYYEFLAEHGLVGTVTIFFVIFYILIKSLKVYLKKKKFNALSFNIIFICSIFTSNSEW